MYNRSSRNLFSLASTTGPDAAYAYRRRRETAEPRKDTSPAGDEGSRKERQGLRSRFSQGLFLPGKIGWYRLLLLCLVLPLLVLTVTACGSGSDLAAADDVAGDLAPASGSNGAAPPADVTSEGTGSSPTPGGQPPSVQAEPATATATAAPASTPSPTRTSAPTCTATVAPSATPTSTPTITPLPQLVEFHDPCDGPSPLDFHVYAAAAFTALNLNETDGTLEVAPLGEDGAHAAAQALIGEGGFCSVEIPVAMLARFDEIREEAAAGRYEKARVLIARTRSDVLGPPAGAGAGGRVPGLASPLCQDPDLTREAIRIVLGLAELEILLGAGDGQQSFDAIADAYRDLFGRKCIDADIEDLLRMGDEAARLGLEDVAGEAWKMATDLAAAELDAALGEFDPCTAFPEDVFKLAMLMEQAALLGVEGMEGPGGARYDAAWYKIIHAYDRLDGEGPLPDTMEMPVGPPPECVLARLEVRLTLMDCLQSVSTIPLNLEPQGPLTLEDEVYFGKERVPYEVHGEGEISWSGKCHACDISLQTRYTAKGWYVMGEESLSLNFSLKGGELKFTCPHSSVFSGPATNEFSLEFPMQDGATQQGPSNGSSGWEFVLHVQKK